MCSFGTEFLLSLRMVRAGLEATDLRARPGAFAGITGDGWRISSLNCSCLCIVLAGVGPDEGTCKRDLGDGGCCRNVVVDLGVGMLGGFGK